MQIEPMVEKFEIPMTRDSLLRIIKVTPLVLDRAIKAKKIGHIKIGHQTLFTAEQVNAYLDSLTVHVKSENKKTNSGENV